MSGPLVPLACCDLSLTALSFVLFIAPAAAVAAAAAARQFCRPLGIPVIINDRVDVALAAGETECVCRGGGCGWGRGVWGAGATCG